MSYKMQTADSKRNKAALIESRRKILFILQTSSFGDRQFISSHATIFATGEEEEEGESCFQFVRFFQHSQNISQVKFKKNLRGLSPQANYTHRTTAACRRS
jgi:hypothetical protein